MLLIIVFIIGFGTYTVASDEDFLGGPDLVYWGAEAEIAFELAAGFELPPEARVIAMLDGGFQDRFLQTKLSVATDNVDVLLSTFGTSRAALIPAAPNPFQSDLEWWDLSSHATVLSGEIRLGSFTSARLSLVDDPGSPGMVLVYIIAFDT